MAFPAATIGWLFFLGLFRRMMGQGDGPPAPPLRQDFPIPPPGVLDSPQPFPQQPASDLPAFPAAWEYFQPPPPAVVTRAWQLLVPLWQKGEGSTQAEQTAGQWVTYLAQRMPDQAGKPTIKGVTAWRVRSGVPVPPSPPAVTPPSPAPAPMPVPIPVPQPQGDPNTPIVTPRGQSLPTAPVVVAPATYIPLTPASVPTGPPAPMSGPTMSAVQIQSALNSWRAMTAPPPFPAPLATDGKIGPLSTNAILAFQNAHPPLTADGKAGPLTQAQLRAYLNVPAPAPSLPTLPASYAQPTAARPPMTNAQIQTALNAAGAMPPLVVDGKIGPASTKAITAFQTSHPPLAADGKAGPLTQAQLWPYLMPPSGVVGGRRRAFA